MKNKELTEVQRQHFTELYLHLLPLVSVEIRLHPAEGDDIERTLKFSDIYSYPVWIEMQENRLNTRPESRLKILRADINRRTARSVHLMVCKINGLTKEELLEQAGEDYYKTLKQLKIRVREQIFRETSAYASQLEPEALEYINWE